jgi:hypothetical protein
MHLSVAGLAVLNVLYLYSSPLTILLDVDLVGLVATKHILRREKTKDSPRAKSGGSP